MKFELDWAKTDFVDQTEIDFNARAEINFVDRLINRLTNRAKIDFAKQTKL